MRTGFVVSGDPRAVSWSRDGATWRLERRAVGRDVSVVLSRDAVELATLAAPDLWDVLDAVGVLFDGAVRPEVAAPAAPVKTGPPQAGARWTVEDDEVLAEAWRDGGTLAELAADFERTNGAIVARLVHLGLVADRDEARDEDLRRR